MVSAAAITLNTVSCAVPVAAFLYFFTVLGSGVATFEWSERHDAYGNPLLGAALALPMVIYVCDGFNHWQRTSLLLAKRAAAANGRGERDWEERGGRWAFPVRDRPRLARDAE